MVCPAPEYLYSPYDGDVIGVPLEPPGPLRYGFPATPPPVPMGMMPPDCFDGDPHGLSTADIIANQSQDYVDEKLAEYQACIQLLQGRQPVTLRFETTVFNPLLSKVFQEIITYQFLLGIFWLRRMREFNCANSTFWKISKY